MRRVLGYIDGQPQWSENTPASTGSSRLGGELVVGGPGAVERERIYGRGGRVDPQVDQRRGLLKGCALDGPCHHKPCTAARAAEARRLYDTTSLTLGQIGALLGGRHYSTVIYLIRTVAL